MSKLIDLTGLSRAITKIKEWVLNQRTHYGDEQILDSKKLSEYQDRMGYFDHRFTVDQGDVSVFISVGGFEKNIKLEPGEEQSVFFIENYDNLQVTISFTTSISNEKTKIDMSFRPEDNYSIHIEDSDYIKVISVQKPLDEVYISNDIARKSDIKCDWNANEGETGYIKNKPFEPHLKGGEPYWIYGTGDEVVSEMQMFYYDNYSSGDEIVVYVNDEEFVLCNHLRIPVHISSYIEFNNVSILDGDVSFEVNFYLESMDDHDYGNEYEFEIRVYEHKQISSNFVSDVVKTTPQKLSDTDKNQALANLGIDNTKYILSCVPNESFDIQEFINKFGFVAEVNDNGYGEYIGNLSITNKELFFDAVLCHDFDDGVSKCIYINNETVSFMFMGNATNGHIVVIYHENDINSTPAYIHWEPLG